MEKYRISIILMFLVLCIQIISAKITAKSLLKSVALENGYVAEILKEKELNISSDKLFHINQKSDTIILTVERYFIDDFIIGLFSHSDSIFIVRDERNIRVWTPEEREGVREYYKTLDEVITLPFEESQISDSIKQELDYELMRTEVRPDFYEKELLLNWDTDSLDILSSYDNSCRTTYSKGSYIPNCQAFRFIIKDGKYTVDSHYYKGYPLPPDKYAPDSELQRRRKIREKLKIISLEAYQKLYERKKE